MSAQIGYRPERIVDLTRRTLASIDGLASIDCNDPAAASALRAVRLARRNLEGHWMPLLRQIESSEAMITWRRAPLDELREVWANNAAWLAFDAMAPNALSALTEQELIDELTRSSDGRQPPLWEDRAVEVDPILTREVARRVTTDLEFARYLVTTADAHTVLGSMLASGLFDDDFSTAIARTLITSSGHHFPDNDNMLGFDTGAALDHLASAHPERCLELLGDRDIAAVLVPEMRSRSIPAGAVENFTTAALAASVLLDESLIENSYRALALVVEVGDGQEVAAGVLRGVVNSMVVHISEFVPYLVEDATAVRPRHSDISLGSYERLQRFYGQAMGDPEAQRVAGGLLGAHLDIELRREGLAVLTRHATVEHSGDPAELIGAIAVPVSTWVDFLFIDGIASEQQRQNMLVGARQAADWTDLITVPTSVLIPALDAGAGVKTVFRLTELAIGGAPSAGADPIDDQGYRFTVPNQVRVAALELVTGNPAFRTLAGLDAVSDHGWQLLTAVGRRLSTTSSPDDRAEILRELDDLDRADRVTIDAFLGATVTHSRAEENAN